MKTHLRLITAAALMILPSAALAQTDAHHPDAGAGAAAAPAETPPPAPMTSGQPNQSVNTMQMMQMMGQMMPMMQQMMQMMQGMPADAGSMPMVAGMSDAGKAYMNAMTMMEGPMMQAVQTGDPDIAFVKAMIPHHQGAIDMAKAVLQYGKDARVKEWANQIIKAQEVEIAQMQEWLKQRAQ